MREVKRTRNIPSREAAKTANGVRRRKRRKRSYALYYLLLLVFVLISGITLSVTVFFNIETIAVSGIERYSAEAVIEKSGISKGDNLFRINPAKAEKKLIDGFTDLDSVKIERKFPNGLNISVVESAATYYLPDDVGYTVVSAGGRVLEKGVAKEETKKGTLLTGLDGTKLEKGGYVRQEESEKYAVLDQIVTAIANSGIKEITEINLENEVQLSVCYQDRIRILLGSISELSYKMNFARNIIETKLEEDEAGVIDASKAGKIYFTPGNIHSSAPVSSAVDATGSSSGTSSQTDKISSDVNIGSSPTGTVSSENR